MPQSRGSRGSGRFTHCTGMRKGLAWADQCRPLRWSQGGRSGLGPCTKWRCSLCVRRCCRRLKPEIGMGWNDWRCRSALAKPRVVGLDFVESGLLRPADEVHLVDGQHDVADADQAGRDSCAAGSGSARPCGRRSGSPPASAVEAPVTMLRVYCSWPGVSATINLRFSVAKKR